MLNRVGNKEGIADLIIKEFPPHRTYFELFFGAGGLFFNKPKASQNILNDKDNNVINFWLCVQNKSEELIEAYHTLPVSDYFFGKKVEKEIRGEDSGYDDVTRAAIFLLRSNMSLYGKGGTLGTGKNTLREQIPKLSETLKRLTKDCIFICKDFEDALKSFSARLSEDMFIYADPPYIGTSGDYIDKFQWKDLDRLIKALDKTGCRFAISEFENEHVLQIAENYNLNVIQITRRSTIKNINTEILLMNYDRINTLF